MYADNSPSPSEEMDLLGLSKTNCASSTSSTNMTQDLDNLEMNSNPDNSELTQLGTGVFNYVNKLDKLHPVVLAFLYDIVDTVEEGGTPLNTFRDVLKKFSTDVGKISTFSRLLLI